MSALKPRARWCYELSPNLTGKGGNTENYAYLYDSNVVTLISASLLGT